MMPPGLRQDRYITTLSSRQRIGSLVGSTLNLLPPGWRIDHYRFLRALIFPAIHNRSSPARGVKNAIDAPIQNLFPKAANCGDFTTPADTLEEKAKEAKDEHSPTALL
jgi:hypothetical protein